MRYLTNKGKKWYSLVKRMYVFLSMGVKTVMNVILVKSPYRPFKRGTNALIRANRELISMKTYTPKNKSNILTVKLGDIQNASTQKKQP